MYLGVHMHSEGYSLCVSVCLSVCLSHYKLKVGLYHYYLGMGLVPSIIDVWGYDGEFCSSSPSSFSSD